MQLSNIMRQKNSSTCGAERRRPRLDLRVVTDLSGEDDKTFMSDDKLDRDVLDLLRSIALAAGHSTDILQEYLRTSYGHRSSSRTCEITRLMKPVSSSSLL